MFFDLSYDFRKETYDRDSVYIYILMIDVFDKIRDYDFIGFNFYKNFFSFGQDT